MLNAFTSLVIPCAIVFCATLLASFSLPCAPARADIYVSNYGNNKISRLNANGVANDYFSFPYLQLTDYQNLQGVAFDRAGNLYVAHYITAGKISKISPDGIATTFATGFSNPSGLAMDGNDNLYVA